jgi:spectinomycin phosphotransferase
LPAICHGDPHLLNLLVDGEALWLIDWDDVVLAPRERDLLFVLDGGVLPFAPVTAEQEAWFFAGYGPVELERERLAYHRAVRALEELVFPSAQLVEPGRASELDRDEARAILAGVLSPTGLVRVAL